MRCSACGRDLADTAKFCGSCGAAVASSAGAAAEGVDLEQEPRSAPGTERVSASAGPPVPTTASPVAMSSTRGDGAGRSSAANPATRSPFAALLLSGGGLALIVEAPTFSYALVDSFSGAKVMSIVLLLVGLGLAGFGVAGTAAPARGQFVTDAPLTASTLAMAVGLFALAFGGLRLLAAIGA